MAGNGSQDCFSNPHEVAEMVGGLKMQSTDPETELISASNLSTIVPYASDVDLRQIIKTEHTGDGGPLTDVRERQLLYYGQSYLIPILPDSALTHI